MLDLKAIRENPDVYRKALARRGAAEDLDRALELDEARRGITVRVEALRAEQNKGSKAVRSASPEERQRLIEDLRRVSDELSRLEPDLDRVEAELREVAIRLPNV